MQYRTIGYHGSQGDGVPLHGDTRVSDLAAWVRGRYLQGDRELEVFDRDTGRVIAGIFAKRSNGDRQWWAEAP